MQLAKNRHTHKHRKFKMRINFFTPLTLPATPAPAKQIDLEEEEYMSEDSSVYSEGDSTSVDDASFDALVNAADDTPLPELDSKDLRMLLLSPLEPDCDF